jgi:hypothetical protein
MVKPDMFHSSTKSQNHVPDSKVIGENNSATHKKELFSSVTRQMFNAIL